jgi:dihydroorotate dehydrogenase
MGLGFPNRIGLAAGLDKNGEIIDGLARMGFRLHRNRHHHPPPQPGNPKPRMFRLPEVKGIINRMGFNNHGIDALIGNVAIAMKFKGILGINIGKNADTPIERAADDYLICLDKAYPLASYITVNISSPNTKNLRQLQGESELTPSSASSRRARPSWPTGTAATCRSPSRSPPTWTTPRSPTSPMPCAATASTP